MGNESRISEMFGSITDAISEQQWFQELKAKWDELDVQSRLYVKVAAGIAALLVVSGLLLSSVYGVYSLKREYRAKSDLLLLLQNANDELKQMRAVANHATSAPMTTEPLATFLENQALAASIDKSAFSSSPEKAGASSESIKESLIDISLKRVNIRQVIRFAFNVENSSRPMKLKNLTIDTKSDPAGYMDATLAISAFSLIQK